MNQAEFDRQVNAQIALYIRQGESGERAAPPMSAQQAIQTAQRMIGDNIESARRLMNLYEHGAYRPYFVKAGQAEHDADAIRTLLTMLGVDADDLTGKEWCKRTGVA